MRKTIILKNGWRFHRGDLSPLPFDESVQDWQCVTVPHDWAITGPFDQWNEIRIDKETLNPSNATGGLPYAGCGIYVLDFTIDEADAGKHISIEFDGVMSHSTIYLNGKHVGGRAYGYSSFSLDVTDVIRFDGTENRLIVRVENPMGLSRWYPGAGIYREARLIVQEESHLPWNGVQLITKSLDLTNKTAILQVHAEGIPSDKLKTIVRRGGRTLLSGGAELHLNNVDFWSPENPVLYEIVVMTDTDSITMNCGFREIVFDADKGLFLNGKPYRFRGLCMHHDLGVFGAAYIDEVMRWRLKKLKAIGCNALRMAHNPPDPKLLDLCDEMGFFVLDEAFDCWVTGKTSNGYQMDFEAEHVRDLRDFIRRNRNHVCVAMWSIGNEIPDEINENGAKIARELVEICHREDPTRPVTAAISHQTKEDTPLLHAFAEELDVLGFNYQPEIYPLLHKRFPSKPMFGAETAAVSCNRGEYVFPGGKTTENIYSSAYATENCYFSSNSETMFAALEQCPWVLGEFAWCSFDYLGEPFPYKWPNHISSWALFDLAGLPKDRAYLYATQWRSENTPHILHILPHWNWSEGQEIPIHVFTSCAEVELRLNGRSLGRQRKDVSPRLVWDAVPFVPGKLEAIGYDNHGEELLRTARVTAGKPARLDVNTELEGKYVFAEIHLTDTQGNVLETADDTVTFSVENGLICGVDNGDVRCLLPFVRNEVKLYNGHAMLTAYFENAGRIRMNCSDLSTLVEVKE